MIVLLFLLVNSREISDKFAKVTSLPGLCKIECKLHNTLNFVKGTIYTPCLINIPENEIVEELKHKIYTSSSSSPKSSTAQAIWKNSRNF